MGHRTVLTRLGIATIVGIVASVALLLASGLPVGLPSQKVHADSAFSFVDYGGLTAGSATQGIAVGPDHNLWFTEFSGNRIGEMTTSGTLLHEYPLPKPNSAPDVITAASDGNLWFNEYGGGNNSGQNRIGKIDPSTGAITEYTPPSVGTCNGSLCIITGLTQGPDGNIWFTEGNAYQLGRLNVSSGAITEFNICSGPEDVKSTGGSLWISCYFNSRLEQFDTSGNYLGSSPALVGNPTSLATGTDGSLWIADGSSHLGHLTSGGVLTEYATSGSVGMLGVGPDGNIWFPDESANKIGTVNSSGTLVEYPITSSAEPAAVVTGPDGRLWYTEFNLSRIGAATIANSAAATSLSVGAATGSYGGTTTLSATLTAGGSGVSSQTISFSLNGTAVCGGTNVTCPTTNSSGVATLTGVSLAGIAAGNYASGVSASFAGDGSAQASSGTGMLAVKQATPVLAWATPAAIIVGTPLTATQLDATASFQNEPLAGSFTYTPPAGTVLGPGSGQTLSASFVPSDSRDFAATGPITVPLNVLYHFGGFLPPLQASGSMAKAGQAIPVKFELLDANGTPISTATATLLVNGQPATSKGNSNSGDSFRYSAPDYSYNLDTTGLSGQVTLAVSLDDGTSHSVVVTMR